MNLFRRRKTKPLFTTLSGIAVYPPLPVFPKHNLLVRFNQSRRAMLNGQPITEERFRQLLKLIDRYHPDAWYRFEPHQSVIVYPKLVVE